MAMHKGWWEQHETIGDVFHLSPQLQSIRFRWQMPKRLQDLGTKQVNLLRSHANLGVGQDLEPIRLKLSTLLQNQPSLSIASFSKLDQSCI